VLFAVKEDLRCSIAHCVDMAHNDGPCNCGWVAWFGPHRVSRCVCAKVLEAASNPQRTLAVICRVLDAAAAETALAHQQDEGDLKGIGPAGSTGRTKYQGVPVTERSLEEVMSESNRGQCDCNWVSVAGKHRKNRCVYRIMYVAATNPDDACEFLRKRNPRLRDRDLLGPTDPNVKTRLQELANAVGVVGVVDASGFDQTWFYGQAGADGVEGAEGFDHAWFLEQEGSEENDNDEEDLYFDTLDISGDYSPAATIEGEAEGVAAVAAQE
jgi:hypothetical protein